MADGLSHPDQSAPTSGSVHATFENAAVGIAHIHPDDRWLRVNMKLCDITGYTEQELLERATRDITHPEDVDLAQHERERLLKGQIQSYTIEKRFVRKDGSLVAVRKSTSLVRNADGSPAYLIAVVDDITQRKNAEADLEFQKYALDQSSIVAITDVEGIITYVNDKFCDISGYSREELIGQNHRIINSGYHPRSFFRDMYLMISRGKVWRGEIRNRRKDGSHYWVDTTIVPAMGLDGRPQRYVAIRTDITERKRAEQDLAFQKYALDQSCIVAITDVQGAITYVNDKFCEISGYQRHELIGQNHRIINSGLHSKAFFRDMYLMISRGRVWRGEIRNRRKDGSFYWVDTTIVPAMDFEGKPERYVAIRTDITERKRIEEQLRQSDLRKDEFLAVLGHELRNPLAAIRMATSVLKSNGLTDAHNLIAIVDRGSLQLSRLVDDLLDVSRITQGKIGLRMERVELGSILAQAMEGINETCKSKGLALSASVPPRPMYIVGDSLRVAQIISNLLSNACKFTEPGGEVQVAAHIEDHQAVIRVRDTGVGIPSDQLSRVFGMFAQVEGQTHKTGGLGIGLGLVKGLTELHGGTVEAHSAGLGMGSEFVVRLPLAMARSTAGQPSQPDVPSEQRPATRRRILAVDDNADLLLTISHMLRASGHEVITAEGGAEALELAREHRPEIVLLDIGMPGMDGFEVARRLRREPWGGDMFLIAMTGWGQERDKRQTAEAGFDAHLTKPVEPEVLQHMIAQRMQSA
jgi:PAS domain S-box-containing protein